jgi:hypothetical protein
MEEAKMLGLDINAKLKQAFADRLINELGETDNQRPKDEWARDIVTLVKVELNKNIDFSKAAIIGTYFTKRYKLKYNKKPIKFDKFVNGCVRKVNAYTKEEEQLIIEWIHEFYS